MIFWKKKVENTITAEKFHEYEKNLVEVSLTVQENLKCLQSILQVPEEEHFKLGFLMGKIHQKLSEDLENLYSIRYSLFGPRK